MPPKKFPSDSIIQQITQMYHTNTTEFDKIEKAIAKLKGNTKIIEIKMNLMNELNRLKLVLPKKNVNYKECEKIISHYTSFSYKKIVDGDRHDMCYIFENSYIGEQTIYDVYSPSGRDYTKCKSQHNLKYSICEYHAYDDLDGYITTLLRKNRYCYIEQFTDHEFICDLCNSRDLCNICNTCSKQEKRLIYTDVPDAFDVMDYLIGHVLYHYDE